MICPYCGAPVTDSATHCPFCSKDLHGTHKQYSFGKISIGIALGCVTLVVVILILFRIAGASAFGVSQFLANILILLASASIIIGGVAFLGKTRDTLGLISMFLGFLLIIGLAIGLSLASTITFT